MRASTQNPENAQDRRDAWEWAIAIPLAAIIVWTTLCLGGFLAETMVVTAPALLALSAVGVVGAVFRRNSGALRVNLAVLLPLPFVAYALASTLWIAPARWLAWNEWLLWFQIWLVFALVIHGDARIWSRALAGAFALLGIASVVMAAYQHFLDREWMMLGRTQAIQFLERSAGPFGSPNSLAGLFIVLIPPCAVLIFSRSLSHSAKVVCGWLVVVFAAGLMLTGSRGGWLSLAVALLAWPLLASSDNYRRLVRTAVIGATVAAAFFALFRYSEVARERLAPLLVGEVEKSRPILWKAAIGIWRDAPWFGSGAASYDVLFEQHRPKGFPTLPGWAHNDYLNTLSDHGALGFVLFAVGMGGLAWLGWGTVVDTKRKERAGRVTPGAWRWKLGLWLGLLAFAAHLAVDSHSKLPALGFAAAVAAGLLLGGSGGLEREFRRGRAVRLSGFVAALGLGAIAIGIALPVYRAEALRYEARRGIDRLGGPDDPAYRDTLVRAVPMLREATNLNPANGAAWADLAYALQLSWHIGRGEQTMLGSMSEVAADRALAQCRLIADFWIRKGVAVDMRGSLPPAEQYFLRAVALSPNLPGTWYHLAHHYARETGRTDEALGALESGLSLDPSYPPAVVLRERLTARRLQN